MPKQFMSFTFLNGAGKSYAAFIATGKGDNDLTYLACLPSVNAKSVATWSASSDGSRNDQGLFVVVAYPADNKAEVVSGVFRAAESHSVKDAHATLVCNPDGSRSIQITITE